MRSLGRSKFLYSLVVIIFTSVSSWADQNFINNDTQKISKALQDSVPIVAFGIVNPFGPTLMGFSIAKSSNDEGDLIFYSLNPFSQQVEYVTDENYSLDVIKTLGEIKGVNATGKICDFLKQKENYSVAHSTPSFFFYNRNLYGSSDDTLKNMTHIAACVVKYSSGQIRSLEQFRKFPLDVWGRVQSQVSDTVNNLNFDLSITSEDALESKADKISEQQIAQILNIIAQRQHIQQELDGFFFAWDGAIQFQRDHKNYARADNALKLDDLITLSTSLTPSLSLFLE